MPTTLHSSPTLSEAPQASAGFDLKNIAARFSALGTKTAFPINHGFFEHPVLNLERVAGLAAFAPSRLVECRRGGLSLDHDPNDPAPNGLAPLETVLNIETCGSWLAFRNIGRARQFSAIAEEAIAGLEPTLRSRGLRMIDPQVDLYLSSPHAMTPCHVDHRHGFLLQVSGTKTIAVFDHKDEEVNPKQRLETLAATGKRDFKVLRKYIHRATAHNLTPGRGLYLPANSPHYVRNGAETSISININFRTESIDRDRGVLWFNRRLRQVGLKPKAPGISESRDRAKVAVFRTLGGTRRILSKR